MRLIFVRHCDPDYEHDTLTEKGFREARILAERVKKWDKDVTDYYVSPLGRAQTTAKICLEQIGRDAECKEWLREFDARVNDPYKKIEVSLSWDYLPGYWTNIPGMYDKDAFVTAGCNAGSDVEEKYLERCVGIDELLAKYGYIREGNIYRTDRADHCDKDATIVCFCHMAVTMFIMGHLLGISPVVFTAGFFFPPSSVTVLATEELEPGIASFRCQNAGDASHLLEAGEPISRSGYFTDTFQG